MPLSLSFFRRAVLSQSPSAPNKSDVQSQSPFVKLTKDPTARSENRVNDTLKWLRGANIYEISQSTYENLRVSENGTRTPLFYICFDS